MKIRENTNKTRKTAVIVGVLFIVATAATVLSQMILKPILDVPNYLVNFSAKQNQVLIGTLFELINALACAGIGICVFPILKKHNDSIAIGYVGFRVIEATMGIVATTNWLSLLTLSQEYLKAGTPVAAYFQNWGTLFLTEHYWNFLMVLIVFNLGALMLYYLLFRSRLVPRFISGWGLIGAFLLLAANLLALFRLISSESTIYNLLALPIGLQEMVLAVWLIVKGFNSSAIASGDSQVVESEL